MMRHRLSLLQADSQISYDVTGILYVKRRVQMEKLMSFKLQLFIRHLSMKQKTIWKNFVVGMITLKGKGFI